MESYNIGFAASNISATISNETSSYSTGAVNSSSFHLQEYNGASSISLDNEERDIVISSLSPGYGLDAGLTGSKHTIFGIKSQYTPLEAILTAVLLLSIIVVTIVGNILVCLAVFLVRKLRRPCNYLLVSLAVSDLCVAILVMPMAMMYEILGRWNFGPVMCDMWVSFDVLSCTASILNLCMISVDRYFAITKPLEYGVKRTPRRMIVCVSFVWLGAACISLPPLLILGNEHEVIDGVPHCVVCQNFGYQIYATLGSFYIPLTVMIVVYYKIFCAARRIVLEERKAQSHLESNHCYLQISVKNGDRPPESKLATDVSSFNLSAAPAAALAKTHHQHHRASTTSTATTCSVGGNSHQQNSIIIINNNNDNNNGGVYGNSKSRPSNESQCPMLQTSSSKGCQHSGVKNKLKLSKGKKSLSLSSARLGARTSGVTLASNSSTVSHTKKLRFQLAKERKASTTLGIIMSAFTICWLPFFVLALVRPFLKDSKSIPSSLSSLFLWLGYANSLLNPIIYATLNRDFRKPFQQILFFRCGSLNHMMREEFYHSQYGDPDPPQHFYVTNSSPEKVAIQNLHIRSGDDSTMNRDPAISRSSLPIPAATCVANESFL